MSEIENIKEVVKEKYAQIVIKADRNIKSSCCGSSKVIDYSMINDDYSKLEGYVADADLKLGCGVPTELAGIKPGDTVVDLGSCAGNDVFISRTIVGENGNVIGIDFTPEMIAKAKSNNEKLGYKNIKFHLGEIEQIPLEDSIADVVISNCVLNLVPDKIKAFSEIFRILKSGAHFCVSDIVLVGNLPDKLRTSAAVYAGCVAGALQQDDYMKTISNAGFINVEIKKTKTIKLPGKLLQEYLTENEILNFNNSGMGIYSITVVGFKK
jgi:SAM-dependent methyltransferase